MRRDPPEFSDTDPQAMEVWLDLPRRMTPGEKLAATLHQAALAFQMREAGVRAMHPGGLQRPLHLDQ